MSMPGKLSTQYLIASVASNVIDNGPVNGLVALIKSVSTMTEPYLAAFEVLMTVIFVIFILKIKCVKKVHNKRNEY